MNPQKFSPMKVNYSKRGRKIKSVGTGKHQKDYRKV